MTGWAEVRSFLGGLEQQTTSSLLRMRTLHVRQHHYQRRQRQNAIKCVAYNAFEGLHTPLFAHTLPLPERKGAKRKKCAALSNSKERGVAANS